MERRELLARAVERWRGFQVDPSVMRSARPDVDGSIPVPRVAASTPKQVARKEQREALRSLVESTAYRELRRVTERQIGATLDFADLPPDERALKAGRPVVRLVTLGAAGIVPEGFATGFLVAPDLLLTNHHVFRTADEATGVGAQFLYERTQGGLRAGVTFELEPNRFFVNHKGLDYAVVAVKVTALDGAPLRQFQYLPLIAVTGKIVTGDPVSIIQHPEGRPKQYATVNNKLLDLRDDGFLLYETDTLEGSSGAPVFNRHWETIGLHHCGVPRIENGQVVTRDGRRLPLDAEVADSDLIWVANEDPGQRAGRVTRRSAARPARAAAHPRAAPRDHDGSPAHCGGTEPVGRRPVGRGPRAGRRRESHHGSERVQLQRSGHHPRERPPGDGARAGVRPGGGDPGGAAGGGVPGEDPQVRRGLWDPHPAGLQGRFLGGLDRADAGRERGPRGRAAPGRGRHPWVVPYYHYSLVMNRDRRLVAWAASNVDYSAEARAHTKTRKQYGGENWRLDPRVALAAPGLQIEDADFYAPAKKIDRGHIVRREDGAWGGTSREAEFGNSDTYHWTNCTPQSEAFNQSGKSGIWGQFEEHIQREVKAEGGRMSVFAGPVPSKDDPRHGYENGTEIQVPMEFWKVVVCVSQSGAHAEKLAYGFVFDQTEAVQRLGYERMNMDDYEIYQMPIREITKKTGVVFDATVLAADVLGAGGAPESIRGFAGKRIRSLQGVVLR